MFLARHHTPCIGEVKVIPSRFYVKLNRRLGFDSRLNFLSFNSVQILEMMTNSDVDDISFIF